MTIDSVRRYLDLTTSSLVFSFRARSCSVPITIEENMMKAAILFKPNNYTESCGIIVAGGWRERNVWYPGRSARHAPKEVNVVKKAMLNVQKSAEDIVAER